MAFVVLGISVTHDMDRYNLRSGFHVTPTVRDSGRTERDHLTGLAARNVAMLSAERIAPNSTESTEILPFSKSSERETHQTEEACELVNRPESGAKLRCVISSLQHLQKHCLYCPRAQYPPVSYTHLTLPTNREV